MLLLTFTLTLILADLFVRSNGVFEYKVLVEVEEVGFSLDCTGSRGSFVSFSCAVSYIGEIRRNLKSARVVQHSKPARFVHYQLGII